MTQLMQRILAQPHEHQKAVIHNFKSISGHLTVPSAADFQKNIKLFLMQAVLWQMAQMNSTSKPTRNVTAWRQVLRSTGV